MDIETKAENLRALIEDRLRIKGRTLSHAIRKAGRLLPKWARTEARYVVQAAEMMRHPKLRLTVDEARVAKAHDDLVAHLNSIDPVERRKTQTLRILGTISFNLILIATAFIIYLVWRGYV